jgi:4-amino-4-deoxy-L-arabinose transferase-like glycosyltransferase
MIKKIFSRFAPGRPAYPDLFSLLAVVIPFAVYMATLAPSVTFFDSGEFLTATASLGSAHSPGYPLFLMFAKPFTWLPLGNIAFRINMATAFSSSLACLGVYLLTIRLLRDEQLMDNPVFSAWSIKLAGLSAACAFAFTPRLWLQSNHDKPYPLLAFITAVIFYLILLWRQHYKQGEERPAFIYAATFLAGMSMAAHQSVVLLLPAWTVLIVLADWRMITRIKELILATAFALFGFSVHLYLPLRATQNPLLNWGDPKSSTQFLWHFLRRGYQSEPHLRDASLLWEQIKAFNVPHEFTWVGVLLVVFALFRLWHLQRDIVIAYLTVICVFLLVIAGYFNTPREMIFLTEEFFTPVYLLTAVLIGVGLHCLLEFAVKNARLPEHFGFSVYGLVTGMFFSLPVVMCITKYYENDQHNNYIAFDYATNSLRSLPQNAVMFTWGDSGAFPLWYLQGVERMREDLDLPHTPHIVFDWYLDSLPRLFRDSNLRNFDIQSSGPELGLRIAITDLIGKRPVYIDFSTRYSVSFTDYVPVQKGIVYRIRSVSEPGGLPDTSVWENYNNRGVLEKISFLDLDTGKAILIYANSYLEAGEFLMSIGRIQEGKVMLDKAERISPEMKPSVQQILMRFNGTR